MAADRIPILAALIPIDGMIAAIERSPLQWRKRSRERTRTRMRARKRKRMRMRARRRARKRKRKRKRMRLPMRKRALPRWGRRAGGQAMSLRRLGITEMAHHFNGESLSVLIEGLMKWRGGRGHGARAFLPVRPRGGGAPRHPVLRGRLTGRVSSPRSGGRRRRSGRRGGGGCRDARSGRRPRAPRWSRQAGSAGRNRDARAASGARSGPRAGAPAW